MPVAKPESSDSRVIAHVDMDCFYVQVEQRKQPQLRGLPTAVVQYNEWKGGALIAVSYEARKFGIKRSMRGEEAKEVCPQVQLVQVPVARGKADLSGYRNAGSEVVSILARRGRCERASIDEVYLDLTDAAEMMLADNPPQGMETIDEEALKSHILGLNNEDGSDVKENVRKWIHRHNADHRDKLLACGILIVAELRMQVLKETEFTCSAGIAHNKMLAKLASGMNKPAQQTVVPFSSVKGLLDTLPIRKMKQLGGKLGISLQMDIGVNTVGDLLQFPEEKLQERYGINTGTWLWNIARGISGEEVEGRLLPKSHGSGKTFPGPRALKTVPAVQHWLNQLCEELSERLCSDLDQNKRIAHTLTLHARAYKSSDSDSQKKFPSKSCPLRYGTAKIQEDAFNLFQAGLREYIGFYGGKTRGSHCRGWGITSLSVSASKIVPIPSGTCSIAKYFHGQSTSHFSSMQSSDNLNTEATLSLPSGSECYSEVNLSEPKIDFPKEESWIKDTVPDLDLQEQKDLSSTLSEKTQDGFIQEDISPLLLSGCLEQNRSKQQWDLSKDESQFKSEYKERKGKRLKDKGTYSIIELFKSYNPNPSGSFLSHEYNRTVGGTDVSSSSYSRDGEEGRREAWGYNIDEIDPSVMEELPPEIQDEIKAWMQPHEQRPNNMVKRSCTISHYFSPSKKS
ncbi:DNA polymerase eta [Gossypium arboreum]|uniref:DNA polymerase eta n=2 Tax=Gossypium arboreum TaxID=29729 RepID=A0A0B0MQ45_GOSAR|nr:DNA polymerase eta isoform X1 [Gossypium arboreum]KHG02850.1 DNA polymerase eta [Gossypium arboreum]